MTAEARARLSATRRAMNMSGAHNTNWKGGIVTRHDGRVLVYCPGHPEAKHRGGIYAFRYRIVASEMLGRPLRADEVVHHINGDPTDDRPDNLAVTTQPGHARGHMGERQRDAGGRLR
jgi:hypothetical protein